jgi:hypothetical protein
MNECKELLAKEEIYNKEIVNYLKLWENYFNFLENVMQDWTNGIYVEEHSTVLRFEEDNCGFGSTWESFVKVRNLFTKATEEVQSLRERKESSERICKKYKHIIRELKKLE